MEIPFFQITFLTLVPSAIGAWLELLEDAKESCLETIISGGEMLPKNVLIMLFQREKHLTLFDEYGPTESTSYITVKVHMI